MVCYGIFCNGQLIVYCLILDSSGALCFTLDNHPFSRFMDFISSINFGTFFSKVMHIVYCQNFQIHVALKYFVITSLLPNRWKATLRVGSGGYVRTAFVTFPVCDFSFLLLIFARLIELFFVLCIAALACIWYAKSCCNGDVCVGKQFFLFTCIWINTGSAN